ncbi:MAG: hypothetical protein NXI31_08630 [bacterium]|nr:hypothetical protein [bacterium]
MRNSHPGVLRALICSCLAVGAPLIAQSTWVVDSQNRPGAQFSDLQSAVSAATAGDTILVRYVDPLTSPYAGAVITKGVTIVGVGASPQPLGRPGFVGSLRVELLPADEHVVLRDLRIAPFGSGSTSANCHLLIRSNAGSVHLQNVDRATVSSPLSTLNQWLVADSGLVTMTDCGFATVGSLGTMRVQDVDLLSMHRCQLESGVQSTLPTLRVERGELVLVDSVLLGSAGFLTSGPAASLCDSALQIAGQSTVSSGPGVAIAGSLGGSCAGVSTVEVSPTSTAGFATGVIVSQASVVAMGASVDPARAMATLVLGEPNGLGLIAAGVPATNPGPFLGLGNAWLEPATAFLVLALPLDATGRGVWQAQLAASLPTGTSVWLQGVVLGATGASLTTPTVLTLP